MRFLFLIPLTAGLLASYLSQKSSDEMAYLTGVFAAVMLVLSLLLAPWQIQLVILLIATVTVRQFWLRFEGQNSLTPAGGGTGGTAEVPPAKEVQSDRARTYRGISYEQAGPEAKDPGPGKAEQVPSQFPKLSLKYRGVRLESPKTGEREEGNDPSAH